MFRSIDGKMAEDTEKVCFKVYYFLSIKQTLKFPVNILLFIEVTVKGHQVVFVSVIIEVVSL